MKRSGIDAAGLKGRTIRVRGIVELRRGPSIELVSDALLERTGPEPRTGPGAPKGDPAGPAGP